MKNLDRLNLLTIWLQNKTAELEQVNNLGLPLNDLEKLKKIKIEHVNFKAEVLGKQNEFDDVIRVYKKNIPTTRSKGGHREPRKIEFTHTKAYTLHSMWQNSRKYNIIDIKVILY